MSKFNFKIGNTWTSPESIAVYNSSNVPVNVNTVYYKVDTSWVEVWPAGDAPESFGIAATIAVIRFEFPQGGYNLINGRSGTYSTALCNPDTGKPDPIADWPMYRGPDFYWPDEFGDNGNYVNQISDHGEPYMPFSGPRWVENKTGYTHPTCVINYTNLKNSFPSTNAYWTTPYPQPWSDAPPKVFRNAFMCSMNPNWNTVNDYPAPDIEWPVECYIDVYEGGTPATDANGNLVYVGYTSRVQINKTLSVSNHWSATQWPSYNLPWNWFAKFDLIFDWQTNTITYDPTPENSTDTSELGQFLRIEFNKSPLDASKSHAQSYMVSKIYDGGTIIANYDDANPMNKCTYPNNNPQAFEPPAGSPGHSDPHMTWNTWWWAPGNPPGSTDMHNDIAIFDIGALRRRLPNATRVKLLVYGHWWTDTNLPPRGTNTVTLSATSYRGNSFDPGSLDVDGTVITTKSSGRTMTNTRPLSFAPIKGLFFRTVDMDLINETFTVTTSQ